MKSIKHYLYGMFVKHTGAPRPDELEADVRVQNLEGTSLVQVEFSEPMTKLMLLPDEAKDLANSLYEMAQEARGEGC